MASMNPAVGATGTAYGQRGRAMFADPFDDLASQVMPRTIPDALRWAQSVHMIDATYAQAMRRVASYFVTTVEIRPVSRDGKKTLTDDEKEKFDSFLQKTLAIRSALVTIAYDYLTYGTTFTSLLVPFKRYIVCPKCYKEAPLSRAASDPSWKYEWSDFDFHGQCPKCNYRGRLDHVDRRGDAEGGMILKRWPVHEMEIINDQLTDKNKFIWKIPESYRRLIREGKLHQLEHANWEVIQAVKNGGNLILDPAIVYQMRDPSLCGIETGGWGLPRAVVNFRQAWYCQLLRRLNEAICQDFIIPFRVLSPSPRPGADPNASDPVLGSSLGNFASAMQAMIKRHRRDPLDIQVSPVGVDYKMLGGEANQLAPFQLIDQATDALLNGSGVPAELYKGTLTTQAAPAALRLFESQWRHLVDSLNGLLEFIVDRAGTLLDWEPVDARLLAPTYADDMNRQMAVLQLMMNKNVSQTTAMRLLGMEFKQEQDNLLAEELWTAERTQRAQEEQQGKQQQQGLMRADIASGNAASIFAGGQQQGGQQGGAPPQGGAQGGGGGQPGGGTADVQDLVQKSQQIVESLQQMPDAQRKQELNQLRKEDKTLHHLVMGQLEDARQEQDSQGGQQVREQMKQGMVMPPGTPSFGNRDAMIRWLSSRQR